MLTKRNSDILHANPDASKLVIFAFRCVGKSNDIKSAYRVVEKQNKMSSSLMQ